MDFRFLEKALILGLLSAIGPFAIDMYLPAMPSVQQDLHTDVGTTQMSLTLFFIAMGLSQLAYGPASDMFGRKPPLYFGLCLFALGSVGCALAPDIHTLIACRILQGLGACAGMVIAQAIVRDMHTGNAAARLLSLLILTFSVSPILAPLVGSLVIRFASWRGIFWAVTGASAIGLLLVAVALEETRPAAQRVNSGVSSALAGYGRLLTDRHFLGVVFIGSFGIASFFAYLANSAFVLINHYGLTPFQFSLAFGVNAASFVGASQCTGWLGGRYGLKSVVSGAAIGYAATMVLLLGLIIAGIDRLEVLMALLFLGYGFLGLVLPGTTVLALDLHGAIAGTAVALMGTLQFATGAAVVAVIGLFATTTALPMVAGIAGCAVTVLVLTRITLRARRTTACAEIDADAKA